MTGKRRSTELNADGGASQVLFPIVFVRALCRKVRSALRETVPAGNLQQ
jgi:hypothetical protein